MLGPRPLKCNKRLLVHCAPTLALVAASIRLELVPKMGNLLPRKVVPKYHRAKVHAVMSSARLFSLVVVFFPRSPVNAVPAAALLLP